MLNDDFKKYKSVRVIGKVKSNNHRSYTVTVEDPFEPDCELMINYFLLAKSRTELHLSEGKIYEFLGEISEKESIVQADVDMDDGAELAKDALKNVMLKARAVKQQTGFHKMVHQETSLMINFLIEQTFNRIRKHEKPAAKEIAVAEKEPVIA